MDMPEKLKILSSKKCWELNCCGQEVTCMHTLYKDRIDCWNAVGSLSEDPKCLLIINKTLLACEVCLYYKMKHKFDVTLELMQLLKKDLQELNSE